MSHRGRLQGSAQPSRWPLVSIVTPTLNRRDLLEQTLRSVRNQTYRDIEHIVVDGGSTDGTVELLRRYEGTYNLRWTSQPDDGMYQAINRGMLDAKGQILAYLNSDDLYLPWAAEVVVSAFLRRRDADFVYGDVIAIDDRTGRQSLNFQPPFNRDYIQRWGFLCQPTVFWRREVLQLVGKFDESLRYVADCDYWMRASTQNHFVKLNEFVAIERNHETTIRETMSNALEEELSAVRTRYVALAGPRHRLAVLRHRLRAWTWAHAYWLLFAIQSVVSFTWRRGPWSRLLESGELRIRWHLLPLRFVPGLSQRRPRVVRPSRYWLEPPPR